MEGNNYAQDVARWEDITISLLSGYLERAFKICRGRYEKQHLYYPLLCLNPKNEVGRNVLVDKDNNEPLIKVSPIALNLRVVISIQTSFCG